METRLLKNLKIVINKISGILNNFCSAQTKRLTPLSLIRIAIDLKKVTEFLLTGVQYLFLP